MKKFLTGILVVLSTFSSMARPAGESPAIRVGTFNLCTSGSRKNFVEKGKQGYIASPQRYWGNSAQAVADMIAAMDCDILGVQEVCDSIWGVKGDRDLRRLVAQRGYDYEWILYPNSGKGTISYDVAIAYKPELFDTLATGIFWTGGIPDKPKTREGEPKHTCKPLVWARFVEKSSGREFYFLDTHTVVPQKYKDDEWPKNRGNVLNLQEIARLGESLVPADVPSILVGDLNIAHNSVDWLNIANSRWQDVYSAFLVEGKLSETDRTWGTQNMKDESASSKWYPDHIMLDGFRAQDFRIDRRKFPTADGTLHYPSDHYPLVSNVVFADTPSEAGWEKVSSPDGSISLELRPGGRRLLYRVLCDGKVVVNASELSMTLSDGTVMGAGEPGRILRSGNSLILQYGSYSLEAAAHDDGVAWRWWAGRRRPYKVIDEQAAFNFEAGDKTVFSYTHKNIDPFQDDFQNLYTWQRFPIWSTGKPLLDVALKPDDRQVLPWTGGEPPLVVTPALVDVDGVKLAIAETDVISYPGMLLEPFGSSLEARFAGYPATLKQGGKRNLQWIVTSRENYIASCDGKPRLFPWRVLCMARTDSELAACDLVKRLAAAPQGDFSWVKPGKVSWEWWSNFYMENVNFTPGINTQTYKYYIDFASRHGVEYILMDEGWAVKFADNLLDVVPEIDLEEILRYGEQKNVGIILWAGYSAFVKDMEKICAHYSAMGVKGFKIDFFERNDQQAMDVMYKTAVTTARHHLLVDFHGCTPPTGLQKTFPNVLNFEGIFGLEQMRTRALPFYDIVSFDVTAPFIRYLIGPADYTPGAFLNATRESFKPSRTSPMSQGTRCHQLAEYVVFDSPLQMLCDSPSNYESAPACADFIYRVPTVWDETRVLAGEMGEYIVTARRSGGTWYIGALNGWTERDITIDLSALGSNSVSVEAWEDGPGAAVDARDWTKNSFNAYGPFTIHLAPGGGWAAVATCSPQLGFTDIPLLEQDGKTFKDHNRNGRLDGYEDWRLTPAERAADLAAQLPPEYLSGLMTNGHTVNVPGISSMSVSGITYNGKPYAESGAEPSDICDRLREALVAFDTRQVLLAHSDGPETIARWNNKVQALCESLPWGIPSCNSTDPRNEIKATDEYNAGSGGVCSQWPTPLGLAATFDTTVVRSFTQAVKREYLALGFHTALSPQADLATDPRWRRVPGTFGENPELVKAMAGAYVHAMQPEVNCIIKHWPGGGTGEGGRDAHLSIGKYGVFPGGRLKTHMDAFCLDAAGVMPYYTVSYAQDPSGENVGNSYSSYIIDTLLRGRYAYKGIVCTDWGIVPDYNGDPLTTGGKCYGVESLSIGERILKAMEAGIDEFGGSVKASQIMQAWPLWCAKYGEASARNRWELSARKILESMFRTGLFENPYVDVDNAVAVLSDPNAAAAGEDAQRRSLVMLKNNSLPIAKGAKVYVPKRQIPGVYSMTGRLKKAPYVGYSVDTAEVAKHYTIVSTPQEADFALVAITEPEGGIGYKDGQYMPISLQYSPYTASSARKESVAGERSYRGRHIEVENATDLDLVKETKAAMGGKPVVVLLQATRPVVMEFEPWADAILVAFGVRSKALLEIVSGAFEPTGRLPMQFPASMDTVEQQLEDVPQDMQPWKDTAGNSYDFGFGLNWSGAINQ